MTNKEKWDALTSDLEAPQSFIDFSWYYTIAAALERRVFFGNPARPLFCNIYVLLLGRAGLGKGVCMRESKKLLSRFTLKLSDGTKVIDHNTKEPRRLFYSLPDTTTFEKLIVDMAECTVPFIRSDGAIYAHASAYFLLEELSSLVKKNKAEDVARFLLNLYDGETYDYRTRHASCYLIQHGCVNLLAGTTLDFLRQAEEHGMLGEGLFSRFFIIFGEKPRHVKFHYSDLTPEQLVYQDELQKYIYSLSRIYGSIDDTPEIKDYLQSWWEAETKHLECYQDEKLASYFARRKILMMKLAAAIHFGECNNSFLIPISTYQQSASLLREHEADIIKIARRTGKNPQYPIQERLVSWLRIKPRQHHEVLNYLSAELDFNAIINVIQLLQASNRIVQSGAFLKVVDDNLEKLINIPNDDPEPSRIDPTPSTFI